MHKSNKIVKITSRKFDGEIHKTWTANLIEQKGTLLSFVGEFENEINHPQLGVIRRGTISYEFFWLDRWFNVFRFHEPDGSLRNFYCNLNMPPTFSDDTLDYVDLDIDVIVWRNFSIEIVDTDEFAENSQKYNYSPAIKKETSENLDRVLKLIENREFPFDIKI